MSHYLSRRVRDLPDWRTLFQNRLSRAAKGADDLLLTGGGEWSTEIDMPRHLIDAANDAVHGRPQYTDSYGIAPLRDAIAQKLEHENGIAVDATSEIVVTSGATEAICVAMLGLLDPGDEVIFGDPYYMAIYRPNVELSGARLVNVRTEESASWRIDPAAIESSITERTKAIVLTSPENPTGAVPTHDQLKEIARIALERDLVIVSDEMYEKFLYDGRQHFSIASFPEAAGRTITINGFSKTYGLTGYRVGYLAGPRALVSELAKIRAATTLCASEVSQRVALAALEGPQAWLPEIINEYERARDRFVEVFGGIDGLSVAPPDGAIYIFANVSQLPGDSMTIAEYFIREARVMCRPGTYFGAAGEGYVRFNMTTDLDMVDEIGRRVSKAVARLRENAT